MYGLVCDKRYTHSASIMIAILDSTSLVTEHDTQHSFLHACVCGGTLPMTSFKIRALLLVYVFMQRHILTWDSEKHHAGAEVVQS